MPFRPSRRCIPLLQASGVTPNNIEGVIPKHGAFQPGEESRTDHPHRGLKNGEYGGILIPPEFDRAALCRRR